jgi:predicted ester cyclase
MQAAEENAAVVRRFFQSVSEGRDQDALAVVSPDWINHEAPDRSGVAGAASTIAGLRSWFGAIQYQIIDVLADRDRVWSHVVMSGHFVGDLYGVAPTGRSFAQHQVHMFRLVHGLLVEHRAIRDDLGALVQVGAIDPIAGNDGAKASPALAPLSATTD